MNPDSAKNYYSFYVQDVYVGFVNILEEEKEVFIGIGTKPACCRSRMKILKNYTLQNPCT